MSSLAGIGIWNIERKIFPMAFERQAPLAWQRHPQWLVVGSASCLESLWFLVSLRSAPESPIR